MQYGANARIMMMMEGYVQEHHPTPLVAMLGIDMAKEASPSQEDPFCNLKRSTRTRSAAKFDYAFSRWSVAMVIWQGIESKCSRSQFVISTTRIDMDR